MQVVVFSNWDSFLKEVTEDRFHFIRPGDVRPVIRVHKSNLLIPRQASQLITFFVTVTCWRYESREVHVIKFKIGQVDWWGQNFADHEERRRKLVSATEQAATRIEAALNAAKFDVRDGMYDYGEINLPVGVCSLWTDLDDLTGKKGIEDKK